MVHHRKDGNSVPGSSHERSKSKTHPAPLSAPQPVPRPLWYQRTVARTAGRPEGHRGNDRPAVADVVIGIHERSASTAESVSGFGLGMVCVSTTAPRGCHDIIRPIRVRARMTQCSLRKGGAVMRQQRIYTLMWIPLMAGLLGIVTSGCDIPMDVPDGDNTTSPDDNASQPQVPEQPAEQDDSHFA